MVPSVDKGCQGDDMLHIHIFISFKFYLHKLCLVIVESRVFSSVRAYEALNPKP